MNDDMFSGFEEAKQNWSKLPHDFIKALPLIKSLAELKVILYVLRHTWGYGDEYKKITLGEFANGRKRKDGTKIDDGTGMSVNAIKKGIKYAIEHGFLEEVVDDSDKARIKKYYLLKKNRKTDYQLVTPEYQKLIPRVSEVDSRTKKETIERNLKERNNSAANALPAVEDSLNQQKEVSVKKKRKSNPTYDTVAELQNLEPTIQTGFGCKVVKELFEQGYTSEQIIECGKDIQQREWWIQNNIQLTPSQIKKHIGNFVQEQQTDEFGNYVKILSDGTQVITLKSEIIQDSNVVVIE